MGTYVPRGLDIRASKVNEYISACLDGLIADEGADQGRLIGVVRRKR